MLQPEGRTGEVWESPNELMVFLLPIQEGGDSLFLSPSLSLSPHFTVILPYCLQGLMTSCSMNHTEHLCTLFEGNVFFVSNVAVHI